HLRRCGIYTTFRYYPLHRLRLYGSYAQLPQAERAAAMTLCLPIHQALSDDDLARVVEAIRAFGAGV
ncbi:MAG: DegT/DnrJ/EryC1/StrS family aminotransferase, partial [Anaerolineae bacterium]|nr:DegT/DnrJ/EryC1/StrS family aminotransferase [Anaerolineae bacterium]